MALPGWISPNPSGATLCLKVQPRASRNEVGPAVGAQLKVKVTAPPVDSAANDAVVELLAERLGCSRGSVQILRGQSSRNKVIQVHGLPGETIAERLAAPPPA
ncbi:MAG TPA: DUF167 domain-containing protein [Verrucomicrobiales bacterium]|nr:DUF167 domain-containing protein [Verrucomicrobiales bacterium]